MELKKISEHTVALIDENLASNAGAVILDDFIVAVDITMRPDTAFQFRKLLEETYKLPVRYALITHSHADHVFGFKAFRDVNLIGSKQLAASLRRRYETEWTPEAFTHWRKNNPEDSAWVDDVEFMIPPILIHERLDIFNNGKVVELHHSGGHTDDSSWGWFPSEGVLFAGDLIFAQSFPYAGDESCNPDVWIDLIKTWQKMDIEKIIPGHGPVVGKDELDKYLEFFSQFRENALAAIKSGKTAADVVLPDVFPIPEQFHGMVERTRNHWFSFYKES